MKFDSRTKYTAVILNEALGEHPLCNYEFENSETHIGVHVDIRTGISKFQTLEMDDTIFDGNIYTEQMCLK